MKIRKGKKTVEQKPVVTEITTEETVIVEEPKSVLNVVEDDVPEVEPIEQEPVVDLDVPVEDVPKQDFRSFDYGDLTFECNRCGHREVLEKDVEGGIQITLPTTDKHNWTLVCSRCKNAMKLFFTESAKKKDPELEAEAVIVEEHTKEVPNELEKEDKKG